MSCPQMALFSASQRCVRQRQAGARLVGEGGAWAASDVAPDQRTRLVTMRLREGRGSTHLARFLLAEEEDDEVSDGPRRGAAGGRVKTSGQFRRFPFCHFVGSLLFWPLGVRARSVGRREQVSGDDTQYDLVCLFIRSFGLVIRV